MEKMYKARYVVSYLAKKYVLNPVWIWGILEDNYNILKGTDGILTAAEKAETEAYIKGEIDAGRA